MGTKGPIPEARANLLGHRSKAELAGDDLTRIVVGASTYEIKDPSPEWHPIAIDVYNAAVESPICKRLYQSTDWAMLYSLCDDLSHYKFGGPKGRSSMMATAIYSAMSNLLLTEGERRRVKVETIAPKKDNNEDAEALDFYGSIAD